MSQDVLKNFINLAFDVLYVLIFLRVIMSWIPSMQNNAIGTFVREVTDPILKPIQKIIPSGGGLDLSPIIAFLLLQLVQGLVSSLL